MRGISAGSQPFVLWNNRQLAAQRMTSPDGEQDAGMSAFCRVFPDVFFVSERPPYFDAKRGKGRLLTAGFHLMQGYYRDDAPLYELVLDDAGRRAIDGLWEELNFVTSAPMRQYKDFIFFERAEPPRFAMGPEFDFARSEDKDATSAAKIEQLLRQRLISRWPAATGGKTRVAISEAIEDPSFGVRSRPRSARSRRSGWPPSRRT